ncbi:unnamed protein product [Aphanomyces euteiches]|uniref:Uncharacterized protein n=1 Tax=Aphanomyces euteiches TaxID=100861 RepID=A0A6G0XDZ5_9STRA|nr:hypothetical protein Ae201684_005848 [Aphanomyces euteiches]KAH9078100.1 hypothetical protein Ae201684P_019202 [Aphanomyces euteiches]KAH9113735.1 hypothetical protein AeMF1_012114 [Aphanomyces euteiches]KAH9122804.1 hypothetical protein LEN26_010104 [Aphanomyces euteiches]KAH9136983.1 hypothetical protein AeRB84_018095 [Aphanomyces euteiches]
MSAPSGSNTNVTLGRKLIEELQQMGAQVPIEFIKVQDMLEACERNAMQVAANIADARREKSQQRLKGNEALLKEQSDMFDKISQTYKKLAQDDEWIKK